MGVARQIWTLTRKTLVIVCARHWFATLLRAVLLPIIYAAFISYSKNLFIPPSEFGIASPSPIRSFSDALHASDSTRHTVAFVHNGHTGGAIESVINGLADTAQQAGKDVQILRSETDLLSVCRSSLRGTTACYGAASFLASPDEGSGGRWNYTLRADGALGTKIYVNRNDNDAELYVLPFQRAIDSSIVSRSNSSLPDTVNQYPFTSQTPQERDDEIRRLYMQALVRFLGVAYYIGIVGIVYHLTGQMALERELGISQLIEAMTPNTHTFYTQAARLVSHHLAFDVVYLLSWIVMAVILKILVFTKTSVGLLIGFHLLGGLALSSFSILGASFFKRAQLSGITVTIVSIILAIIAQVVTPQSSGAVAILGLLFPSANYTFFIIWLARWERQDRPADLSSGAPNSPWQLPGYVFWILFILQTAAFPVLGALLERSLYGTASKSRRMTNNPEGSSVAIKLEAFSKEYRPGYWSRLVARLPGVRVKDTVVAVNKLSLSALKGQIMVLLGANGSGKSTTLDAISGLTEITSGTIEVDGTGGLGLCPQQNVMWQELTVFEHVEIFNKLKTTGKPDSKAEIDALIEACDLTLKRNARSGTLSGGQKRKLQLAMMFTGGSRVCCIDEVSSGLDPLSRRKIWDILLRERGLRSLIFTSHFLDEADYLSDHIAMLSKGNLKAEGSAAELKAKFGGGYRVKVPKDVTWDAEGLEYTGANAEEENVVYHLADSEHAATFVERLDKAHVKKYEVLGPTIEDVFLRLAEEVREDSTEAVVPVSVSPNDKDSASSSGPAEKDTVKDSDAPLNLYSGRGTTMLRQSWVLFRKRVTVFKRGYLPYFFAVIIPVITAGLVTFFLHGFTKLDCSPESQVNEGTAEALNTSSIDLLIPLGPASRVPAQLVAEALHQNQSWFHQIGSLDEFNQFVNQRHANVTPGGFFLGDSTSDTPTMAYVGNWQVATALLTQNLLNNVLSNTTIAAQYNGFALPLPARAADTLQLILYFGLAMSAFPGFFALYPTTERLRNVRSLHYSNGIRAVSTPVCETHSTNAPRDTWAQASRAFDPSHLNRG